MIFRNVAFKQGGYCAKRRHSVPDTRNHRSDSDDERRQAGDSRDRHAKRPSPGTLGIADKKGDSTDCKQQHGCREQRHSHRPEQQDQGELSEHRDYRLLKRVLEESDLHCNSWARRRVGRPADVLWRTPPPARHHPDADHNPDNNEKAGDGPTGQQGLKILAGQPDETRQEEISRTEDRRAKDEGGGDATIDLPLFLPQVSFDRSAHRLFKSP